MLMPLAFVAVVAQQPTPKLTLQEYAVDAGESIVEFSVGFALSRVKGRFPDTHGAILYDADHPERSSISVVIETKTIDTGWPHRDDHLRTDDFFDVDKYPTITFQSRKVDRAGQAWLMTGPLTMHGVTKEISIPFHLVAAPSRNAESRWMILNAVGTTRLSRKEFGILGGGTHNSWFTAARNATVSDSVDVSLEIEGYLPDAESQRSPRVLDAATRVHNEGADALLKRLADQRGSKSDADFAAYFSGGDLVVRALIADGRTADAVALARGLTVVFPRLANAYLVYGFALATSGDTSGAARQYARAREVFRPPVVEPTVKFKQVDDSWYYNDQRVRSALEWGRVHEAVSLAKVLTELYPSTARAHVTYGLARALAGDTAGARASYARALEIDPTETRAMEWMRRLGATAQRDPDWIAPQQPFRIYGNTYYVGTHGLASILVTSPSGHVLIDATLAENAPAIMEHIRALGFRVEDVKLMLNSHAHHDHAAGTAAIQRASGAAVAASAWSASVMEHGASPKDDPQFGVLPEYPPVANVRVISDGDTLRVGQLALTAHLTPGHTPGGTTWSWQSSEAGGDKCLEIVYADSQTPVSADGFLFSKSGAAAQFQRGFATLEQLRCDILVTPHPGASSFFERVATKTLVDPQACRRLVAQAREALGRRLAREGAPKP